MPRPEPGTRVVLPTGSIMQECIVQDPALDAYGMVAIVTTRAYTTKDQWGYPVRHAKGERGYYRPAEDPPMP